MKEGKEVETKQYSHPTVFDSQYGSRQVLDLLSEWNLIRRNGRSQTLSSRKEQVVSVDYLRFIPTDPAFDPPCKRIVFPSHLSIVPFVWAKFGHLVEDIT